MLKQCNDWETWLQISLELNRKSDCLTIAENRTSMVKAKSIKLDHKCLRRNETTAKRVNKQMMEQVADKVRKLCLARKTQTTEIRHKIYSPALIFHLMLKRCLCAWALKLNERETTALETFNVASEPYLTMKHRVGWKIETLGWRKTSRRAIESVEREHWM